MRQKSYEHLAILFCFYSCNINHFTHVGLKKSKLFCIREDKYLRPYLDINYYGHEMLALRWAWA